MWEVVLGEMSPSGISRRRNPSASGCLQTVQKKKADHGVPWTRQILSLCIHILEVDFFQSGKNNLLGCSGNRLRQVQMPLSVKCLSPNE